MARTALIAVCGLGFVLVLSLWHSILQTLRDSRSVTHQVETLAQEVHDLHLTRDRWQQIYHLSKAARDYNAFAAHLEGAHLLPAPSSSHSAHREGWTLAEPQVSPDTVPVKSWSAHGAEPRQAAAHTGIPAAYTAPRAGTEADAPTIAPAAVLAPANDSHPALTREWVWQHSRESLVIVTTSNFHFIDFVENWALHLANHHIANYLVGAMDRATAERLRALGVAYFAMFDQAQHDTGLGEHDFGWGSGKFHKAGRQKLSLLQSLLGFGLDIVLCDTDMVWINDPTDYFNRFPAADILTSSDHMAPTIPVGDDGLELPSAMHSAMNIGAMLFRHSNATKVFVADWMAKLESDDKVWDQNAYNDLLRQGAVGEEAAGQHRLFAAHDGRLLVGVLPVAAFASGHTYHVQHLAPIMEVKPYIVHQTFQFGGTKGKRHRLREAMLWYDDAAYHSGPRFVHAELSYLPEPPGFDGLPDFNMSLFHLENMQHQLKQVRQLLSVALLTNRTVVMPKLLCYCDRYWGPVERCRLPGATRMQLPFICPLDHIFEPFHFDDHLDRFGPAFAYREHSFFDNERTPSAVKDDVLTLKMDENAPPGTLTTEDAYHLRAGPNTTLGALQARLDGAAAKVLRLEFVLLESSDEVTFVLEPFDDPKLQKRFESRLEHMPGFWCCRKPDGPMGPGGTPYGDMLMGRGIVHRKP